MMMQCTVQDLIAPTQAHQASNPRTRGIVCLVSSQHVARVWYSKPEKTVDKPSWQAPHQTGLFPVSVEWEPPFSMLVDLVGHGDHQVVTLIVSQHVHGPNHALHSEKCMRLRSAHCSSCEHTA